MSAAVLIDAALSLVLMVGAPSALIFGSMAWGEWLGRRDAARGGK